MTAALQGAVLVAGIVLAWQVHRVFIAPRRVPVVDPRPPQPRPVRSSRDEAMRLSDLRRPEVRLGLKYLARDPGEIPAPTGSAFLFGHEWPGQDGLRRQLWYSFAGSPQSVVDHYRRILKDRRMDLVSDRNVPEGKGRSMRRLVFHTSDDPVGDQVMIGLRRRHGGRGLILSVTTIRRAGRPAGQERDHE